VSNLSGSTVVQRSVVATIQYCYYLSQNDFEMEMGIPDSRFRRGRCGGSNASGSLHGLRGRWLRPGMMMVLGIEVGSWVRGLQDSLQLPQAHWKPDLWGLY
jgi:hypothetical protein